MADTYTVFAHKLIPGTQRDSLHVLDGLLANQTGIQPEIVSTDTAGASEIVFALAWALGYRWAPRLADLPDQRLWRTLVEPARHELHAHPLRGGLGGCPDSQALLTVVLPDVTGERRAAQAASQAYKANPVRKL